jgi:hypothetical protein
MKIRRVDTEEHVTENNRASNVALLSNINETPLKNNPFEHNETSNSNIVHVPVENYLDPPDEEEYEDEEEDDQEMLNAIQQSLEEQKKQQLSFQNLEDEFI